jgi:hypothetical protein
MTGLGLIGEKKEWNEFINKHSMNIFIICACPLHMQFLVIKIKHDQEVFHMKTIIQNSQKQSCM